MHQDYHVRACNTAPDSENRIHDDHTAAAYGFRGGLVPGITVYGYLTVPVVQRFGEAWLARGGMRVRFDQPVYEGDELLVTLSENIVSARHGETVCATGEIAWPESEPPDLRWYPEEPLPAARPPATDDTLSAGRMLGTVHGAMPYAPSHIDYPSALLYLSNQALMQNVRLGPWIHVSSELRHFGLVDEGDTLVAHARVAERFERKGHRFVTLDIVVVSECRLIQHVRHTAIYQLRPPL